jgi:hypothetical protein
VLNETYSKFRIGEHFSDSAPEVVFYKEMLYHHCFSTLL